MPSLVQRADAGATAASIEITLAATPTPGNVLILTAQIQKNAVPVAPEGWTLLKDSTAPSDFSLVFFGKLAGAAEPKTVTLAQAEAVSIRAEVAEIAPTSGTWRSILQAVPQSPTNGNSTGTEGKTEVGVGVANSYLIDGIAWRTAVTGAITASEGWTLKASLNSRFATAHRQVSERATYSNAFKWTTNTVWHAGIIQIVDPLPFLKQRAFKESTGGAAVAILANTPTPGNALIAIVGAAASAKPTVAPAGFTELLSVLGASQPAVHIYGKIAGEAESKEVSATFGTGTIEVSEVESSTGAPWLSIAEAVDDAKGQHPGSTASFAYETPSMTPSDDALVLAALSYTPGTGGATLLTGPLGVRFTNPGRRLHTASGNVDAGAAVVAKWTWVTTESVPAAGIIALVDPISSTPVSADLEALYRIRELAGQDLAVPYDLLEIAGKSVDVLYRLFASASSDLEALYDLRGLAATDLGALYGILEIASADLEATYDLRELAGADLAALYDIIAVGDVGASLEALYGIREAVGADLDVLYRVRSSVAREVEISYRLRAEAGRSLEAQYRLRASIAADLEAVYSLGAAAGSSLSAEYGIRAAAAAELEVLYAIGGLTSKVGKALAVIYGIRASRGGSASIRSGAAGGAKLREETSGGAIVASEPMGSATIKETP